VGATVGEGMVSVTLDPPWDTRAFCGCWCYEARTPSSIWGVWKRLEGLCIGLKCTCSLDRWELTLGVAVVGGFYSSVVWSGGSELPGGGQCVAAAFGLEGRVVLGEFRMGLRGNRCWRLPVAVVWGRWRGIPLVRDWRRDSGTVLHFPVSVLLRCSCHKLTTPCHTTQGVDLTTVHMMQHPNVVVTQTHKRKTQVTIVIPTQPGNYVGHTDALLAGWIKFGLLHSKVERNCVFHLLWIEIKGVYVHLANGDHRSIFGQATIS